jgi:hypothetical protein
MPLFAVALIASFVPATWAMWAAPVEALGWE